LNLPTIFHALFAGMAGACVLFLDLLWWRGEKNQRERRTCADSGGLRRPAQPIERAAVLGPIKAEPFGWPRRRGQP